ncbi:hypothetical protein EVAR_72987_1 [Eumeta japonica]|uniref:Uncharacterized protein n=1 Tax=Eumeta variegata TaxID=151549 RepID=A0A4C1SWT4_EUMVA|nr:hypothetical protein EVAR_72987_1 [Eumeta japonica]
MYWQSVVGRFLLLLLPLEWLLLYPRQLTNWCADKLTLLRWIVLLWWLSQKLALLLVLRSEGASRNFVSPSHLFVYPAIHRSLTPDHLHITTGNRPPIWQHAIADNRPHMTHPAILKAFYGLQNGRGIRLAFGHLGMYPGQCRVLILRGERGFLDRMDSMKGQKSKVP